jgi:hypothetical protein
MDTYAPNLRSLPFSFGKGSEAALIWHMTERRVSIERATAERGGALREPQQSRGSAVASTTLIQQKPVQAQGPFGPRLQLPTVPSITFQPSLLPGNFNPSNGVMTRPRAMLLISTRMGRSICMYPILMLEHGTSCQEGSNLLAARPPSSVARLPCDPTPIVSP